MAPSYLAPPFQKLVLYVYNFIFKDLSHQWLRHVCPLFCSRFPLVLQHQLCCCLRPAASHMHIIVNARQMWPHSYNIFNAHVWVQAVLPAVRDFREAHQSAGSGPVRCGHVSIRAQVQRVHDYWCVWSTITRVGQNLSPAGTRLLDRT
jgi:hypothetical protein